jgi:hypothetical protein
MICHYWDNDDQCCSLFLDKDAKHCKFFDSSLDDDGFCKCQGILLRNNDSNDSTD